MKEEVRGAGTQRGPQHGQQEMQEDGDALRPWKKAGPGDVAEGLGGRLPV